LSWPGLSRPSRLGRQGPCAPHRDRRDKPGDDNGMNSPNSSPGLDRVRAEIARGCREANRDPAEVTLVAVSKTFGAEAIEPVIAAGQRVFGENRVQEAKTKWPALLQKHDGIELHLIGPLQSNKAKEAVALFDAIHSLDRPSLCEALAKEIARQGRQPLLFVEINTGAEAQKAGVLPPDAPGGLPPRLTAGIVGKNNSLEHRCYDGLDDAKIDPAGTEEQQR